MNLFNFNEYEIIAFFLVLLRISAFIVSWPVFGSVNVPGPVKILLALIVTILIFPVITFQATLPELESLEMISFALKEVFTGLVMGYLCRLFFFVVSMAGNIISLTMGLSQGQLYNPALNATGNSVEQFYVILGTLFFLAINGHHYMLVGLQKSFEFIPVATAFGKVEIFANFGMVVNQLFEFGVRMAGPVLVTILFANIAMGIIGRAVPQINVLITALPANILVGLLVLIISIPLLIAQMGELVELMAEHLFAFIKEY